MRVYTFAVGLISATLALEMAPGRVWAIEVAAPATVQSENAADLYRQAVALTKDTKAADDADDWAGRDKLPKETAAVLEQQKEIIALIHRARGISNCDWGDFSSMKTELGS